jgi:hypothetical protein
VGRVFEGDAKSWELLPRALLCELCTNKANLLSCPNEVIRVGDGSAANGFHYQYIAGEQALWRLSPQVAHSKERNCEKILLSP